MQSTCILKRVKQLSVLEIALQTNSFDEQKTALGGGEDTIRVSAAKHLILT